LPELAISRRKVEKSSQTKKQYTLAAPILPCTP